MRDKRQHAEAEKARRRANREEYNAYQREYRLRPENHAKALQCSRKASKKRIRNLKERVIVLLGGCCTCVGCTISDFEFLTVDPIAGGGCKHRKTVSSQKLYALLLSGQEPKEKYRLLCMNCNFALGKYGCCPHQRKQEMT